MTDKETAHFLISRTRVHSLHSCVDYSNPTPSANCEHKQPKPKTISSIFDVCPNGCPNSFARDPFFFVH